MLPVLVETDDRVQVGIEDVVRPRPRIVLQPEVAVLVEPADVPHGHHARGEVVVCLDADGQNDPEDIPRLLAKLDEGYDVVSGWRKNRKDTFVSRRLPSMVANAIISKDEIAYS